MSLSITDLKKGTIFQLDGVPYRVVEYSQKVMGRGGSIVNVKVKSLTDGKLLAKTFKGSDTLESADVINNSVQFLYTEGQNFYFMDNNSFEQFEVSAEIIGDQSNYIKEGDNITVQIFDGRVIGVELPKNVPLKVVYTEMVVKGDTSTAITKDAEMETGVTIKVPAFIKTGDVISIDTTNGTYRERVK